MCTPGQEQSQGTVCVMFTKKTVYHRFKCLKPAKLVSNIVIGVYEPNLAYNSYYYIVTVILY